MRRAVLVALGLSAPYWLFGQSPARAPAFDVAAIKPNRSPQSTMGGGLCYGGITSITNYSLSEIVQQIYDVRKFQIVVRPSWFGSEKFDIRARSESRVNYQQCVLMMQALLTERFGLRLHRETRQMSVFRLVIAKGGAKLRKIPDGAPIGVKTFNTNTGRLDTRGSSMQQLARMLAVTGELESLVIDATGLDGAYEFTLEWTPPSIPPDASQLPGLLTALQQQLGLKLESGKGPVEVLVIDHVQKKPTEN